MNETERIAQTIADLVNAELARLREERDEAIMALQKIASYNEDDLRSWLEDNAVEMVEIAREALYRIKGAW